MNAHHTGPVVVGVDGSDSALDAVRWGAAESARRNVALRLVTAFAWDQVDVFGPFGLGSDAREALLEAARRQLAEAAAEAEQISTRAVEQELISGFPVPVLRTESRRAQLIVLGDRGYGGVSGLLLGSVAVAMAAQAECPVVLVRPEQSRAVEDHSRPIAVGVDGSDISEAAVAFAFDAASTRGAPLVAVHAWQDLPVDPLLGSLLFDPEAVRADESALLAERMAGWSGKYPDVEVQRVITRDRPARALVEQSRRAQLVVVGSRGRGAAAGLLLGSVSHAVLYRAHCSVAVVRPRAEDES